MPFGQVKTTEGHHFRRGNLQRMMREGISIEEAFRDGDYHVQFVRGLWISDGNEVIFLQRAQTLT